ncbi:MAG: YafY family transcriptional regulator [Chloroflexi bacterium]|nr:YafY family transcriptional regulator [Chloroflexota bacterium]MCC6896702.1 YafY family transcriptional regulator [Anaerolineae bacterium]
MYNPTTRLLAILELLQSHGEMSGLELAQKLEVEERSIRRYIMMLRDMGIPIDGERGRHGGYSLRPGFRLPPLMFNADEITAVVLGLMLARELGVTALPAIESASAKIERVLPEELRQSTNAIRSSLVMDAVQFGTRTVPNQWITLITFAIHEKNCVHITYASGDGELTERQIAPYGLLLHARTWYLPAYCFLRQDERLFRLDRVHSIIRTTQIFNPPPDFDAKQFVLQSLARMPNTQTFEILIHAPFTTVEAVIPSGIMELEAHGSDTLARCYTDDPHWLARYLARLEMPFTVLENDTLRAALQSLADGILASINQ